MRALKYDNNLSVQYSIMAHVQTHELKLSCDLKQRVKGRAITSVPVSANFLSNPPKGRSPHGYKPIFKDVGIEFSMLSQPPTWEEIDTFEHVNKMSVWIYQWWVTDTMHDFRMLRKAKEIHNAEVTLLWYEKRFVLILERGPYGRQAFFSMRGANRKGVL